MTVQVYGIRHHGPGCARSLLAALAAQEPDILLIEGPPDADGVLTLAGHPDLRPPVALLVYRPDAPREAVFYPFAAYSPEWQAIRFALVRDLPVRFIDLPQAVRFAIDPPAGSEGGGPPADVEPAPEAAAGMAPGPDPAAGDGVQAPPAEVSPVLDDPIGLLAEVAGFADRELWWECQVEQREDARDLFAAILEAMTAIRAEAPAPDEMEARREAQMRQAIRAARREGFRQIAVVCGAWHAPALVEPGSAKDDAALLAGLRPVKVAATWIPWTNSRLAYRSGYGAGVRYPGWYDHLWSAPDRPAIRWVARAARLLRAEDLPAPSSGVIEAIRLGEALAALRGLPRPGFGELREAIQAVLCGGDPAALDLIHERIEIADVLGTVPEDAPVVPLQRDLAAEQRRLRLKPSVEQRALDLDLRDDLGRARSHLLHRLLTLGIDWGQPQRVTGKSGTFHEVWTIRWQVEFEVRLIEASVWGNTIETAAAARLADEARGTDELPGLAELLDRALLAGLADAVDQILDRVRTRAAVAADLRHLMDALPPLARVARYGDVRGTRADRVAPIVDGLFERVVVGLSAAAAQIDDDAAAALAGSIGNVQASLDLIGSAEQAAEWSAALRRVMGDPAVHALIRGWCCRLLLQSRAIDGDELQRQARLALSPAVPPAVAAAWIQGVLRGSGLLLLQQDALWAALDAWVRDLAPDTFVELLPLLRRAFADFQAPERRAMGEKVKRLGRPGDGTIGRRHGEVGGPEVAADRAGRVLPVLARILGGGHGGDG